MRVSTGAGFAPEVLAVRDLSWTEFCDSLRQVAQLGPLPPTADEQKRHKSQAGWLSPCTYRDAYRNLDNVQEAYAIGFDFDEGTEAATLVAAVRGYNFVLVSTYSHYVDGQTPRYRLFIPYAVPITERVSEIHGRVFNFWRQHLDGVDLGAADVSRLWYMPAAPDELVHRAEFYAEQFADSFDWRQLPEEPAPDPVQVTVDGLTFEPGQRHRDFLRLAGQLRRGGVQYEWADMIVRHLASQVGADEHHHVKTLRDVYERYEAGEAAPEAAGAQFAAPALPADIDTKDWPPQPCAIAGMLPLGVVSLLASQDGLGKSRLALTMAAHVAAGRPLFGWMATGTGHPVYILNKEDPQTEVYRRLRSILAAFTPAQVELVKQNLRIASVQAQVELITQVGSAYVLGPHVDALCAAIGRARLVVLDTLSRMHGYDENSNSVAAKLVGAAERVAQETGAAVMFVHHTNKLALREGQDAAGGSRGAHAFEGNSRCVMRLLHASKADREAWVLPAHDALKLVQVKFSYGPRLKPIWLQSSHETGRLEQIHPDARAV